VEAYAVVNDQSTRTMRRVALRPEAVVARTK
jgi:hypothetical protein